MNPMPIRNAAYLAIFLHFARKIMRKIAVTRTSKPWDFMFFRHAVNQVDVTITEYDREHRCEPVTYAGIIKIRELPPDEADGIIAALRANLERLNSGEWRKAFRLHRDRVADAHFRISSAEPPYDQMGPDFLKFRIKYGIVTYSGIRNILLADTKLLYLGHAEK